MRYARWNGGEYDQAAAQRLREAGYPALLAAVLAARGVSAPEETAPFLEREERLTWSPLLMRDMDRAVERIGRALADGERIAVFGDYDVDGITATVLVVDYLRSRGADCLKYIPRRIEDGYGLGREALKSLRDQGVTLVITVDCGVTGVEEARYAREIGMDLVITDHHECKDVLPDAVAVVDPRREDCPYPFKHLAGVGVALKLVLALGQGREEALFARYCTLAAIGTVADVMRMSGENRAIVQRGLRAIASTDFLGLRALLRETGLWGKEVTSTQIGFILAPRINAAGRMGAAELAADLLLTGDEAQAERLARELCELNRERQAVEQEIYAQAVEQIETLPASDRRALVLSSEVWHQGVVGIVASRLSEKYSCPSFMIHLQNGMGKGSCRSYGGFNLFSALESCADLLTDFGGHALAAGFTIREENIPAFAAAMNDYVSTATGGREMVSVLDVDGELDDPGLLTLDGVEGLDLLEPYGAGNPKPVFSLSGCLISAMSGVGGGRHLKLKLSAGGRSLDAIFFSATAAEAGVEAGDRVDVAFTPQINEYRGWRSVQLQLCDLRPALTRAQAERALYEKFRRGEALTRQEAESLLPTREEFVVLWRYLKGHANQAPLDATAPRLARSIARSAGRRETVMRTLVCLEVFDERGLIRMERTTDHLHIALRPVEGKVDLDDSSILRALRRIIHSNE